MRGPRMEELDASPDEIEDHLQLTTESWYNNGINAADKDMSERY